MNTVTGVTRYAPVTKHVLAGITAGQGARKSCWVVGFRGQLNSKAETARPPASGVGSTTSENTVGPSCTGQPPEATKPDRRCLSSMKFAEPIIARQLSLVTASRPIGGDL